MKFLEKIEKKIKKSAIEKKDYLSAMADYPFPESAKIVKYNAASAYPSVIVGNYAGIRAEISYSLTINTYILIFRSGKESLFSYPLPSAEETEKKIHDIFRVTGETSSPSIVQNELTTYMVKRRTNILKALSKTAQRPGSGIQVKFFRILSLCYRMYPGLSIDQIEKIAAGILSIAYQPLEEQLQNAIFMVSPAVMPPFTNLMKFHPQTEKDGYFLMGEMARGHAAMISMQATQTPKMFIPPWMGHDQIRAISKTCARVMEREKKISINKS